MNLNTATAEEIAAANIERLDRKKADELVKFREENGPFNSWDDVKKVPGFNNDRIRELQKAGVTLG